jgi:hypothetical protein
MNKITTKTITLVASVILLSCAAQTRINKNDYELLKTAAYTSSYAIIGEYGDNIPDDLNTERFLQIAQKKIPAFYYAEFKKYDLEVTPMKTYYLLKAYDPETHKLILYDYSCTEYTDGNILDELQQNSQPENSDPCKTANW